MWQFNHLKCNEYCMSVLHHFITSFMLSRNPLEITDQYHAPLLIRSAEIRTEYWKSEMQIRHVSAELTCSDQSDTMDAWWRRVGNHPTGWHGVKTCKTSIHTNVIVSFHRILHFFFFADCCLLVLTRLSHDKFTPYYISGTQKNCFSQT
jgi:hypothetical protein